MKLIIFIILFSQVLGAQELIDKHAKKVTNYTKVELARFGEEDLNGACTGTTSSKSLYDEGGSLYNVKQQDQDGLATCYANTASLILKSYNPELPTPSYLDLASYNNPSTDKDYNFNYGDVCNVLNKAKKNGGKLCSDGIIENQTTSVQDKILYKLHNVINKYNYSKENMIKILDLYEGYINKNPRPEKISCEKTGIKFDKYINSMVDHFSKSDLYEQSNNFDEADMQQAQKCADLVSEKLKQLNYLTPTKSVTAKNNYGEFEFNPALRANISNEYEKKLKTSKLPSGKSKYDYLVKLLDSQPTSSATYRYILGYNSNTQSQQYSEFLKKMILGIDIEFVTKMKEGLKASDPAVKLCLEKAKPFDSNEGLFFNSILGDCFDDIQNWRNEIWEFTKTCHDGDKELFDVFKTLTALGKNVDDMSKYIVDKDNNILRKIIDNNCENKNIYKMPISNCSYIYTSGGLGSINNYKDWKYLTLFKRSLGKYQKLHSNEPINLKSLANFILNNSKEANTENSSYRNFLSTLFKKYGELSPEKATFPQLQGIADKKTKDLKQNQLNIGKKIFASINEGHAVGISTCGSLFSDKSKKNYEDCSNHAVTATGVRCIKGRLKVEISNSWGIGCNDEKKTSSLFKCQRDIDGLPNGRAWVDFGYLSDQAMRLRSF